MGPTIGIEASSILKARTGIGQYTYQLLRYLAELDRVSRYRIFTSSLKDRPREPPWAGAANFTAVHSRIPGKVLLESWRRLRRPRIEAFLGPLDLFHSTNNNPVPQAAGRRLLTVYDLYFMRRPERTERWGGRYFHSVLPRHIHEWDRVITISAAMARELRQIFSLPAERISVVPCGVDRFFFEPDDGGETGPELPERYLLAVGTLEPRKAYPRLLRAFRVLRARGFRDHHLVIAGAPGLASGEVEAAIDELGLGGRVHLPGYLPPDRLRQAYRRAEVFTMLSEYEGFGIPVLEAMACGTPVVTADGTSFPEVVGDAGLLVDAESPELVANAFARIITSPETAADFARRGLRNARRFTWRESAERTLEIYRALLADESAVLTRSRRERE